MISVFELFKIGIGPSSSHTTGPMKAAERFRDAIASHPHSVSVARIVVTLFGSLAWTGKGHASEKALVLGLNGLKPETVDPDDANRQFRTVRESRLLAFCGRKIPFDVERDIIFDFDQILPGHSN